MKQAAERQAGQEKKQYFLGKIEIMAYVAYEIRMTKDTPTGMRYLVRCNHTNKWAICSWVSSTGAAIGNPECQGKYEYVMKKWHKLVGKYVSVT